MTHDFQMLDLNNPETPVEILISRDGRLWVNVDGKCALRIHGATYNIEDERWFFYHHPESSCVFKLRGKLNELPSIEPVEEITREEYLRLLDEYGETDPDIQGGTYTSEEPHAPELPPTDKASMPMPMSLMHFLAEISADEAEELHEWMDGNLTAVDRFLDGLAAKYRDPEPPEHYGEPPRNNLQ